MAVRLQVVTNCISSCMTDIWGVGDVRSTMESLGVYLFAGAFFFFGIGFGRRPSILGCGKVAIGAGPRGYRKWKGSRECSLTPPANSESFFRRAQKLDSRLACRQQAHAGSPGGSNKRGVEMATWSLCTRSLASSGSSQPIYINLENVLTVER